MSKWSTLHTYATGLANAMKAYNDNDLETMNMHLSLLDKLIETQTLGTNLEIAKMKLQAQQQVNPLELELQYQTLIGKQLDNMVKLGEIQDKETLDKYLMDYANRLSSQGIFTDPSTAYLMLRKAPDIQNMYSALRTGGQVQAEIGAKAPTGESLYDISARAGMSKDLLEIERAKEELESNLPELEARQKATVAGTTIEQYPRQQLADTIIRETEAKYREDLLKSEILRNEASARFLDPSSEARQWFNTAVNTFNKASELTQDIIKLESQINNNSPDLATTISSIISKYNLQPTQATPTVLLDLLRTYRDQLESMSYNALNEYKEISVQEKGEQEEKVVRYGIGPYASLDELALTPSAKSIYERVLKDIAIYRSKGYRVVIVPKSTTIGPIPKVRPAPTTQKSTGSISSKIASEYTNIISGTQTKQPQSIQKRPISAEERSAIREELLKRLKKKEE